MSNEKDLNRIKHMILAIEEAVEFIGDAELSDFRKDRKLLLVIVKEIEIVGEASSKVTEDFRKKHSQIPWKEIVSVRNRLIHGYFDINAEIIWKTLKNKLVPLLQDLKKIR